LEGQGEVGAAGYPPAKPVTWPGRQYTNLPFRSQANRRARFSICNAARQAGRSARKVRTCRGHDGDFKNM
jgi:hypothetical protein